MSARVSVIIGALVMFSAGVASAQNVKTDFDQAVDFSKYSTYYWAKADPSANDLMNQRMVSAVDSWLTTAGWTKAPEGQAQLAVVPIFTTSEQTSISSFYDGYGYGGWGYGGWGAPMGGSSTTMVSTFLEGTLIVDLFDASSKKLVWRGIATDTISDNPKKNAEKIQKAAKKMFEKKFPPPPAQAKK